MRKRACLVLMSLAIVSLMVMVSGSALAAEKVKIGVLYSITGPGSVLGPKQAEVAKMAFEEVNAVGGVNIGGKKHLIEVVERDDETKPGVAIRRVNEMVKTEGIKIVQGGTFAHVSLALNGEAKKDNFFLMTTNGVPDTYFEKDTKAPYSLAVLGDNGMVGRGAALYVIEKLKAKRVVFFHPDYAYGKFAWAGAEAILKQHPEVQYQVVWSPVGAADMTSYLIKAMEFNPDVICFNHWGNDMITALKQAGEMGLNKKTKLFVNWIIDLVAKGIPPEVLEGVDCQTWWYHNMEGFEDAAVVKATTEFAAKYKARFGVTPDPYVMTAYYGSREIIRAMELSGSTDPEKMYKALMENRKFDTAKGPAEWRVDGRPQYKYNAWIIRGLPVSQRSAADPWSWGRIIDVYSGEAFLPPVSELGW